MLLLGGAGCGADGDLLGPRSFNLVEAQDRPPVQGPQFPGDPARGQPKPRLQPPIPLAVADDTPRTKKVNIAVYETVNRSVVHITTRGARQDGFFMGEAPTEGAGSGSVIDKAGHLLTNYHVIEDAGQVNVTPVRRKVLRREIRGADPANDVAVIKIDAAPATLFPVTFGDSSRLVVGMRVFAIGNPFGLGTDV